VVLITVRINKQWSKNMSLTDKLDSAYNGMSQAQDISKARALIQPIRADVLRIDAELQVIADSSVFDTADIEIKQALLLAWDVIKDAKTGFENATVTELLDWRPSQ
jgi:hypothetical protein